MPRCRRVKDATCIYHVMGKSISDTPLFIKDEDKDAFLAIIKGAQKKFSFKLYAYCLMTNHVHLIIDANGCDISKIMHRINQCYAQNFNRLHDRTGHLFADRFKSLIVDTDNYLFTLSAYIHNNPTDIEGFEHCPEKYKYSTLGMYLGLSYDTFGIVDKAFVLSFFGGNVKRARNNYYKFVMMCDDNILKAHYDFKDEKSEYRSERRTILYRNFTPEDIIEFITNYMHTDRVMLRWKYKREAKESRALCIFLIRYYCDFSYKQICEIIGRLTLSRVSKLSDIGLELIESDQRYRNILQDFLDFKKLCKPASIPNLT